MSYNKDYTVTFVREYVYWVNAEDEDSAVLMAHNKFREDCLRPVANTSYDYVEVECDEEFSED